MRICARVSVSPASTTLPWVQLRRIISTIALPIATSPMPHDPGRSGPEPLVLTPAKNSRAGRTRMAAVMLSGYIAFLTLYAPQPILPLLSTLFHAQAVTVSLTLTVASLGVAIAAPIAGVMADRMGRKRVIVWSAFGLAATTLISATSTTLPVLIFWRFLQGLCTPGVFSVTVAYVNEEWEEGAGAAVGSYVTGSVLGGFSSRIVSGFVAAHAPWQAVFLVTGLMILAGALAVRAWLPVETHFRPQQFGHDWGAAL